MNAEPAQVPEALLNRIIEVWHPVAIWLFGSRARGDAREDSDWDLMVVVADDTPDEVVRLRYAYRSLKDLRLPAEVIPVRRSMFEERRRLSGSLPQVVWTEGRLVYGV